MNTNDKIIAASLFGAFFKKTEIKAFNIYANIGVRPIRHGSFMRGLFLTLAILAGIILLLFIQNKYLKRKINKINSELRRQHDWLKTTLSSITEGVIATDTGGRVAFINCVAKELLGIIEKESKNLIIDSVFNIYNEGTKKRETIPKDDVLNYGKVVDLSPNTILLTKDNKRYYIESTVSPLRNSKDFIIGMVIVFRDITDKRDAQTRLSESYQELESLYAQIASAEEEIRHQYEELQLSEHSLKLSEERYRLATIGCNDGIWDYNVATKELFYSDRCKEMLNIYKEGNNTSYEKWISLIHEEDIHKFEQEMDAHLNAEKPFFKVEYRIKTNNHECKWFLSRGQAIWDSMGNPIRMAGSITDITDTKKSEELIYHMAYYDRITEFPNKAYLERELEERFENPIYYKKQVAMLFIDLDNFKSVNDILGHYYGDEMLKKVAEKYKDILDENCNFFHLGGDKFCIILKGDNAVINAKTTAEKILKIAESAIVIKNLEFYIAASIGISLYPEHGIDFRALLKNAETAMYCAKELGKNDYIVFDENMIKITVEKLDMEKSLRYAIKNQEFIVYYQPQIDMSSGIMIGMEALVRWNHPKLGFISPMQFIPLAEETGLIIPIGEQILKMVCSQLKAWKDKGFICVPVAVNISARQFENGDLLGTVDKSIKEANIDPSLLEVEITETIAMSDFEFTIRILEELKQRGIMVSLDDFGTGYSSLNYLKKLPINRVKIDKSFVRDLSFGSSEEVIAEAIINIAHRMKLSVVAEGVETEGQLQFLKSKGCDVAQGYFFSKPVSGNEIEKSMKYKWEMNI